MNSFHICAVCVYCVVQPGISGNGNAQNAHSYWKCHGSCHATQFLKRDFASCERMSIDNIIFNFGEVNEMVDIFIRNEHITMNAATKVLCSALIAQWSIFVRCIEAGLCCIHCFPAECRNHSVCVLAVYCTCSVVAVWVMQTVHDLQSLYTMHV